MSKVRFFNVSSFYPDYLDMFYKRTPSLSFQNYEVQYRTLMNDFFGWADYWKTHLEKTGKYEVFECYCNAEYLQKEWAKENNIDYDNENWQLQILKSQILNFKPDVIFFHNYSLLDPSFRTKIKMECPSIKFVVGWDGTAINDPDLYKGCDLMLSCSENITQLYSEFGYKTYFFEFGFEKSILNNIIRNKMQYDISFVGSIVLGKGLHNDRYNNIARLAAKTPLSIFSPHIDYPIWKPYKYPQRQRIYQGKFNEFFNVFNIGRSWKGIAYGLKMYNVLANSKISFNSHINKSLNKAGNMRLFEATGVGSCLVTDWKSNLHEIFISDKEIVVYKNIDECIEKVKWLLKNEKEMKAIAAAGQRRTLENYSFELRINAFSEFLLKTI